MGEVRPVKAGGGFNLLPALWSGPFQARVERLRCMAENHQVGIGIASQLSKEVWPIL